MLLFVYKWLIAAIIALVTLGAGIASLRVIDRYQDLLAIGDAFADGIFLGTATFHLFPDAIQSFPAKMPLSPYLLTMFMVMSGFFLLFFLERTIIYREKEGHILADKYACKASAWMLVGILSVHAFIAGAALGLSNTIRTASIILIAIVAHKGFESFALMVGLYRKAKLDIRKLDARVKSILWTFTFVTPFGIILATFIKSFLYTQTANITMGLFSAFVAGSFLYIGTLHDRHNHFHPPRNLTKTKCYKKTASALTGVVAMSIVAIWT